MGEGGISPHYFLYEMEMWECQYFIDGYNRRYRPSWEQHRSLVHSIASMFCERGKVPTDTTKFMPLPWDKSDDEPIDIEQQEQELQALMDSMNQYNAAIDQQVARE